MRLPLFVAAIAACLAGCAPTTALPPDPPGAHPPGLLPIRAVPPAGALPVLPIAKTAQPEASPPLSQLIVKVVAPAVIPIVAVQARPTWTMTAGNTVGQELQAWGEKAGWKVIWNLPKDWSVPANSTFTGDFKTVATEVIKTLAANGALVRAQFYDGNKTLVVSGPGAAPQ